jgi:large subunit ribosomal protein L22
MAEARAKLRRVRMSPRKTRIVANLVRGRSVEEAVSLLRAVPRKPAPVLTKLILSAAANAGLGGSSDVDADALIVKTITVDEGPTFKRWRARAMGRATRINKRTSHITVVVSDKE